MATFGHQRTGWPRALRRGHPVAVAGASVTYPVMTTLPPRRRRKRLLLNRLLPPMMTTLPPSRRRKRLLLKRLNRILSHPLPFLAGITIAS